MKYIALLLIVCSSFMYAHPKRFDEKYMQERFEKNQTARRKTKEDRALRVLLDKEVKKINDRKTYGK